MEQDFARRRGRPPLHDPATIESLLRRRSLEGLSWARLSAISDIPISTLQSWSRRQRAREDHRGFIELSVKDSPILSPLITDARIEIITPAGIRVLVPMPVATTTSVLREILTALRPPC